MRVNYYDLKYQIDNFHSEYNYPICDSDECYPFDVAFPLFWHSRHIIKSNARINLDKIKGNSWVFKSNGTRYFHPLTSDIRPALIFVYKIMGSYFVEEGNQRLHVSKLLNRKSILADIFEYDYEHMLNKAVLHLDRGTYYVSYNQLTYELNHEEATNFRKLQSLIV